MVDKLHTFAERLKHLRKKHGLSLAAVGQQIGVSPQAVHKWENGGSIDDNRDWALAELFNVNPRWLRYGDDPVSGHEGYPHHLHKGSGITPPSVPNPPETGVFVPFLDHDLVVNWFARMGPFDYHSGAWIACPAPHGGLTFALRVQGSSMENLSSRISYSDGDIIFVDPTAPHRSGTRVIFTGHKMEEGQLVIFRELIMEGGKSFWRPLNPQWPERIEEVWEGFIPLGRVIGKWSAED